MVVMMPDTVLACGCGITKAAAQLMVDGAIVKLDVPSGSDEEHRQSHQ